MALSHIGHIQKLGQNYSLWTNKTISEYRRFKLIQKPARLYTAVSGIFLLIQGISTLAFRLYPPLDHAFPALLAATHMIPIHSTLHIVTGVVAVLILYRGGDRGAFWFALGFGIFYLGLGLAGMLSGQQLGLGLHPLDHPIHLALGIAGIIAAGASAYRSGITRKNS
jgi:hypothetical protein